MKREDRYIVIKHKDAVAYLTPEERSSLARICTKIAEERLDNYRGVLECVVVERDWPEYEPTWAMIAARVDAKEEPQA